jgi:hypothetical protein
VLSFCPPWRIGYGCSKALCRVVSGQPSNPHVHSSQQRSNVFMHRIRVDSHVHAMNRQIVVLEKPIFLATEHLRLKLGPLSLRITLLPCSRRTEQIGEKRTTANKSGPRLNPGGLQPQHPRKGGRKGSNARQHVYGARAATREYASNGAMGQQQTHHH